jgi:asparagine synthase (glutamine-hydrolysing)
MCGIAGTFIHAAEGAVDPGRLEGMRDAMAHRGPDGVGAWISPSGRVGLAHRRLSIIDLSTAASQPLSNEDGNVWVVFNGEIYNHEALRRQLIQEGHRFATDHSDTEVLVHGYESWGIEGLVQAIEGDFAFGLWDERAGTLHLVRDRIGVKPLYYAEREGQLHFASEIKALLAHPDMPRAMNPQAMGHYLTFLTTPPPWTMFEGVYKLLPGHYLTIQRATGIRVTRYWDALPGRSGWDRARLAGASSQVLATEVRTRLADAVACRNMSDVPIGVFLSGGIDSTTNLALMSAQLTGAVNTFTVGFKDYPALNETSEARWVAEQFGANHHEVLIDRRDMEGYLDTLIHTQDEPIADWVCIPLHFVSKLARESGVRVVQVGEGSDEQFVGYPHYRTYQRIHRWFWRRFGQAPEFLRGGIARSMGLVADHFPRFERHAEFLERSAARGELFWSGASVFWDRMKRKLLADPDGEQEGPLVDPRHYGGTDVRRTRDFVREMYRPFDSAHPEGEFFQRLIYSEFKLRLPELLLMRVDKISMASSIEARVPFLDHRLVEFTMDLSDHQRVGAGVLKGLLKEAVGDLIPSEILHRRKRGFDAPMSHWLRESFGREVEAKILASPLVRSGRFREEYIRFLFQDHRAGRDSAMAIWALFNLVEWHRFWIEE